MSDKTINDELARATKIVKSWPQWKQFILVNSLKATNTTGRVPIVPKPEADRTQQRG